MGKPQNEALLIAKSLEQHKELISRSVCPNKYKVPKHECSAAFAGVEAKERVQVPELIGGHRSCQRTDKSENLRQGLYRKTALNTKH